MTDLRWWLEQARPWWRWFAAGVAIGVITMAANMALLAVAGWFITAMALAGLAAAEINYYTPSALIRALAIVRTGGRYAERLLTHSATLRLLTGLRVWFYRQVEPLSVQQLSAFRDGDLLARIRADIDALDGIYLALVQPVAVSTLCLLGACATWALYSPLLATAEFVLLVLLAAGLLPAWIAARARQPGEQALALGAQIKAALVDLVTGLDELTLAGAQTRQREHVAALTRAQLDQQARLARLAGLGEAATLLLTQLALLVAIVLVVPAIRSGQLDAVDFAPILLLVLGCLEAVAQMPAAWQALGTLRLATRRLRAFETMRPAVAEPAQPSAPPREHTLRLEQVSARHADDAPWVLRQLSLTIRAGEHLALVGASGAGKSTLIALLLRLQEYQQGRISWGGRPLSDYHGDDLRAAAALVPQHVHLFHASIRDNLAIADPSADLDAMQAAARVACVHDEIMALPAGYDTVVGEEGLRLSGGQIRRIGIARALLRDAPLFIMDEPGEGLDAATTTCIQRRLAPLLAGRTLIVVSHQPQWVALCPRIAVLENGLISAVGPSAQVAARSAEYRRLLATGA